MKIEEIKELIQALEQSTLTSLEVSQGTETVRLERNYAVADTSTASVVSPATTKAEKTIHEILPEQKDEEIVEKQVPGKVISCPLVGVFYIAPSPDDEPFVTVGSQVKKGDVLCIVEAMKLMNEITAEKDGTITKICVQNGQVVEYGQPLFYLA